MRFLIFNDKREIGKRLSQPQFDVNSWTTTYLQK